jgi:multidrug efflux pump subunit AcrA (membrane-fusion protein)
MSARRKSGLRAVGLALIVAGVALSGCTEVEPAEEAGYEPAKVQDVEGSELKQVTLTAEGAERTGLQTAPVRRSGDHRVVPYSALIYDGEGKTFVYTAQQKPRSFLRAAVVVDRIEGDRVLLADGPAAGSRVVTIGATEVYGTELDVAGSH